MQSRRWAVLALSLLLARYLLWRLGSTLNFSSASATAISLLLLGCELMLLLSGFLPLWFSLARQRPLKPQPLHRFPAVDLLLPSCGEPLEVVRRSLQGCAAIHYPALTVWLLDDSNRLALARKLANRRSDHILLLLNVHLRQTDHRNRRHEHTDIPFSGDKEEAHFDLLSLLDKALRC